MLSRFTSCLLAFGLCALVSGAARASVIPSTTRIGDYRTQASGNFTTVAIWETFVAGPSGTALDGTFVPATHAPTNADGTISIRAGHTVQVNSAMALDELIIEENGILEHTGTADLTLSDSPAPWELIIAGTYRELSATNRLLLLPGANVILLETATWRHSADGGWLPDAMWDDHSLLLFDGITTATALNGKVGQVFGRVTWNCPTQTSSFAFGPASTESNAVTSVAAGDFRVMDTGTGRLQLTSGTKQNPILLDGNYEQFGGNVFVNFSATAPRTLDVSRDFILRGGTFTVNGSANAAATGLLRVLGKYQLAGGVFNVSLTARTGSVAITGPVQLDAGALLRSPGSGTATFNFASGPLRAFRNAGTISGPILFSVAGGATVDFTDQSLTGDGTFTLSDGAGCHLGSLDGISAVGQLDAAKGNIQVGSATVFQRTYSPLGRYLYTGTQAQATGSGLPNEIGTATPTLNAGAFGVRLAPATTALTVSKPLRVSGELVLESGIVKSAPATKLTLSASAFMDALTDGSDNSYVQGVMARDMDSTTTYYPFPLGDGGAYRPLALRWNYPNDAATYEFTANRQPAPNGTALSNDPSRGLTGLVGDTYWDLARTAGSNGALNAIVRIPYDYASVLSPMMLTVAGYNTTTNRWEALPFVGRDLTQKWVEATLAPQYARVTLGTLGFNPLPVELVSFTAVWASGAVSLNWTTATETNSAYFVVERSTNGTTFADISQVEASGTSTMPRTYTAVDDRPQAVISYYRLRQVDRDGSRHYSQMIALTGRPAPSNPPVVFPNPTASRVTVRVPGTVAADTQVRVFNPMGQQVLQQAMGGRPELALDLANLPDGTYTVQFSGGDQPASSQRLVKASH